MSRSHLLLPGVALALVISSLCWRATVQPLVTDEVEFLQTGPSLMRGEGPRACGGEDWEQIVHHPQGYHLLLGALAALSGGELGPLLGRLPGILSFLLCLPLVVALSRRLDPKSGEGRTWIAAALLATTPLAVQAALLIDIDSTILAPALLGFVWLLCRRAEGDSRAPADRLSLGLAFGALLWIKLPTPFLATFALAVTGLVSAGRRRLLLDAAFITLLGALLFTVSWALFCHLQGLDALGPLTHLAGRGADHASLSVGVLAKRVLRLALWLGPWLPLAALCSMPSWWRSDAPHSSSRRMVLAFAVALGLGYLVVGGESYGFPRYHVPLVPALAVLAASQWESVRRGPVLAIGAGLLVFWLVAVGDPLLPAYTLSETVAIGDAEAGQATRAVLITGVVWVLPGLALLAAGRRKLGLGSGLVVLSISCGLATTIQQLRADYSTHYLYGERGAAQARGFLEERGAMDRRILVPKDLAFGSLPCGSYLFAGRTLSRGRLLELLEEDALGLVVLRRGLLADAGAAVSLDDPRVKQLLSSRMRRRRVGDFLFFEPTP